MPWPDFTELSFGFCFLREFEQCNLAGGSFHRAPDFISQYKEATEGHDVEIALEDSTPVFLQFKRSKVLTRRNAREITCGDYADPKIFRMYLHKKDDYRQHAALQQAEAAGNQVFYVTSQISNYQQLSRAFLSRTVVSSATAMFSPSEIVLPDLIKEHHVSFKARDNFGYVYSEEGRQFKRRYPNVDEFFQSLIPERRPASENRKRLADFVKQISEAVPQRSSLARLVRDADSTVAKASILSFFYLDAQLTFFQPEVAGE